MFVELVSMAVMLLSFQISGQWAHATGWSYYTRPEFYFWIVIGVVALVVHRFAWKARIDRDETKK